MAVPAINTKKSRLTTHADIAPPHAPRQRPCPKPTPTPPDITRTVATQTQTHVPPGLVEPKPMFSHITALTAPPPALSQTHTHFTHST